METLHRIEEFGKRRLTPAGIKEANNNKQNIIVEFEKLVEEWMSIINTAKSRTGKARIMIYGSHATGTALVNDDIDILILAPDYCDR